MPAVDAEPKTESSALAMRMPTAKPRIDATSPVSAASIRTERNTCARVAPSARSSASSRVRCATRMLNVLMIRNEPTNSEMNAKTSSGVPMNVLIVSSVLCSASCCSLLAGLRLGVARQRLRDALAQHDVGDAAVRAHQDAVVLALGVHHLVGRRTR